MSALVVAGLVASGSATNAVQTDTPAKAPEALLAASTGLAGTDGTTDNATDSALSRTVGLLPVTPESPRKLRAMTPASDGAPMFAGTVPLRDISLPATGGALGIPEIVLAAYRNAELALESSMPGCGVSWSLLAGIGRIESGHASSGRTDAAGTTVSPIFGPALDGTLPGNEIIMAADGSAVRAIGPMQFLPGTWSRYAADGNGDGVSDPHNVFDAALAAGKYLCSGGLNLRDPQQELRSVLRYNNSMSYAATVLSWSMAYRTGGTPSQVNIAPNLIPPGTAPIQAGPDMTVVSTTTPAPSDLPTTQQLPPNTPTIQTPTEVMITIPGLPPIPCGIFCPPPKPVNPCDQPQAAQLPAPGDPAQPPIAPAQAFGVGNGEPKDPQQPEVRRPIDCVPAQPGAVPAGVAPNAPAPTPGEALQNSPQAPTETPEPGLPNEPAPAEAPAPPPPPPGIVLPFGITIPLPAPPPPAP